MLVCRGAQASSSASHQHPKPEILPAPAPPLQSAQIPTQPAQSDTERSVEAIGKITAVVDDLEAKVRSQSFDLCLVTKEQINMVYGYLLVAEAMVQG